MEQYRTDPSYHYEDNDDNIDEFVPVFYDVDNVHVVS